ncbi:MAG: hypothetical protein Q7K44_01830 [Candidatus Liptonbacteria bacterium]|nr:hypothetical protein [Candidatus Liptonbacteria bacterium]
MILNSFEEPVIEEQSLEVKKPKFRSASALSHEGNTEAQRLVLQEELNFKNRPGNHTKNSSVVESRFGEVKKLREMVVTHPELAVFERALYTADNIYLIPEERKEEAETIARQQFLDYIKKYEASGVTPENIVDWKKSGMPGAGTNKTWIYDNERPYDTWRIHVVVEDDNNIVNGKCLPKSVIAYHEVMHAEETPKGVPESYKMSEIVTTLKTIILVDEIYKKLFGAPLGVEVDYGREIARGNQKIKLGQLANFYRDLENKYKVLGKAVVSEESLRLIKG